MHKERQRVKKRPKSRTEPSKSFKRGYSVLKKMGRESLMLDQKANYPDMYDMSVSHLFGDVWGRPGLSLRDRQLITLAANIALCRPRGNYSHYRSAMHIGIKKEEIFELMIQVAHYAGWPTLSLANSQFSEVLKQEADRKKGINLDKPLLV
jgi:4-carboxymuconolactone decarboxylase